MVEFCGQNDKTKYTHNASFSPTKSYGRHFARLSSISSLSCPCIYQDELEPYEKILSPVRRRRRRPGHASPHCSPRHPHSSPHERSSPGSLRMRLRSSGLEQCVKAEAIEGEERGKYSNFFIPLRQKIDSFPPLEFAVSGYMCTTCKN